MESVEGREDISELVLPKCILCVDVTLPACIMAIILASSSQCSINANNARVSWMLPTQTVPLATLNPPGTDAARNRDSYNAAGYPMLQTQKLHKVSIDA